MQTLDTPFIHCLVKREFLTNFKAKSNEMEECYIFAVTIIAGRPPLFTIHTEKGAVYSRLPIHAFRSLGFVESLDTVYSGPSPELLERLCPWTCVGNVGHVIEYSYLKGYDAQVRNLGIGRYLFTVDYFDGNFAEDPEQHKSHNIIELQSGMYAAVPNNYMLLKDAHFTTSGHIDYTRQSVYWRVK